MLDQFISGAGAVTDLADRFARLFTRRGGHDLLGSRPGSALVVALLLVFALVIALVGVEASGNTDPRRLDAGGLATTTELDNRTYATVAGAVHGAYVETYVDTNENASQDPDEVGQAWYYFLVDPTTLAGLTVRSSRSPEDVFVLDVIGQVVADPTYIEDDRSIMAGELAARGVTLEPTYLIDTTLPVSGTVVAADIDRLPAEGTVVALSGSTLSYTGPSCDGVEQDLDCSEADVRYYDVVLFDPATNRGVIVYTTASLEMVPATFTGMVRRDERAVDDARTTPGLGFDDLGLTLSDRFLLEDGATPANAMLAFTMAALSVLVGGIILTGLVGRYLVYRRGSAPLPAPAQGLALGERIPLHVTGRLRSPGGEIHVREALADLVRYATSGLPPTETGPIAEPTSTLIVERRGKPEGVALGLGELHRLSAGAVKAFRGPRPALRAMAGTGPILLSFDDDASRDRAAAALLEETGLTVTGAVATDTPAPDAPATKET